MAKDHSTETFGSWSKGLLCSPRIDRDTGAKVKTERHPDFLFLLHIIKERSQDADKHGHYSAGVEKKNVVDILESGSVVVKDNSG